MEEDYLGNSLPNIFKKIIIIFRSCTKTYLMKNTYAGISYIFILCYVGI